MKQLLVLFFSVFNLFLQAQYSNLVELKTDSKNDFEKFFEEDNQSILISKIIEIEKYPNQPFVSVVPFFKNIESENIEFFSRHQYENESNFTEWAQIQKDPHTAENILAASMQFLDTNVVAIQFKIAFADEITNNVLNVSFYYPGKTPQVDSKNAISKSRGSADCDCEMPSYQDRSDWCPPPFNCPQSTNLATTTVTHLIVHHSVTSNTASDWAAQVRSIHNDHTNTNGWADVGYNYLIDPNGVIYEGRGDNIRGAHFSCMNNNTMGVCLLGNYEEANPSQEMLDALVKLLGWKSCDIDASPIGSAPFAGSGNDTVLFRISGHRNGNGLPNACTATVCPGENVYSQINSIRANTSSYIENCEINNVPEPENSDVIIVALEAEPSLPEEGEVVNLSARIRNIGEAAITQPFNTSLQINGDEIDNFTTLSLNVFEFADFSTSYVFEEEGTYQYCIFADGAHNEVNTANNSFCINIQVSKSDDIEVSIQDASFEAQIKVFPNPTENYFNIFSPLEIEKMEMYNTLGQLVYNENNFVETTVSVNHLSDGLYFLKLYSGENMAQLKVTVGL